MVAKLVKKTRLDIEDGFIYFINNDGNVCRIKEVMIPGKKQKVITVLKSKIERKPGYAYFLDKRGNISRVFLEEGSKQLAKKNKKG